jgi:hypothetical protein
LARGVAARRKGIRAQRCSLQQLAAPTELQHVEGWRAAAEYRVGAVV